MQCICMKVKLPFGLRLWSLVAGLLLVGGGIIYGLSASWRYVVQIEATLSSSQVERFQIASEVRRELLNLNNSMISYVLARDPQEWAQFERASSDLDHWIDARDPSLNPRSPLSTEAERQVFRKLNAAYDDYLSSAWSVHSNGLPAMVDAGQLSQLSGFNLQAERMRRLVRQLGDAHRAAEAAFLAGASASLGSLRQVLIAGVVILLALVGAMGWVIYRETIAPLRIKLVQSQTLLERQQNLATLGTLAAGIAHEIRNPLTSLKARLYTLQKHLKTLPAARKDTDMIGAEISRLERILQDMLSFARPSEPRPETIATETLLAEVHGLMSPYLESREARLVVEPGPALFIRADSGHLKQVLINLIRNAAEAVDAKGTVTLRARVASLLLDGRESQAAVLEVADDGEGILPEVEKRLFDPFFSTKDTGTGLGLPIAARLVEQQGGLLQYQTRPGHGTTFGVVLPREIKDSSVIADGDANIQAGGG